MPLPPKQKKKRKQHRKRNKYNKKNESNKSKQGKGKMNLQLPSSYQLSYIELLHLSFIYKSSKLSL